MQVIQTHAKTEDVVSVSFAGVIFDLMVGLHSGLGGKKIGTGTEIVRSGRQAEGIGTDRQLNSWRRIEDAGTGDRVSDSVLKFRVTKPNAMSKTAGIEIDADDVGAVMIHIGKGLE